MTVRSCLVVSMLVFLPLFVGPALPTGYGVAAPAPKALKPGDRVGFPDLRREMNKIVEFKGIDDNKATLADALDFVGSTIFGKNGHLLFRINENAFKKEEIANVAKTEIAETPLPALKQVRLRTLLELILVRVPSPSGAIPVVREDVIEITTRAAWLRELGLPPETTFPLVSPQFRAAPAEEVLRGIALEGKRSLLIDPRVEKKTRKKITVLLTFASVEHALELTADMIGLVIVRRGNIYYVTSAENAGRLDQR